MAIINRCAVGIAPRPPLIAWSRRVSGDEQLHWEEDEHGLYLLPAYEDDAEGWQVLRKVYGRIFEEELRSWCTDSSLWPDPRPFSMFEEWFEIRFYDLIEDLCDTEISHERIDPLFLEEVRSALQDQPSG